MNLKKIVVSDVDGVLNTGQFLYDTQGKQYKVFGPHDMDGVKMLRAEGFEIQFISADKRGFEITKRRINDMKLEPILVTEGDRYKWVDDNYGVDNIIFMGDGIHDAPIILDAGFGIAPVSGRREAIQAADFVTQSKAGDGAFLDAAIRIISLYKEHPQVFE